MPGGIVGNNNPVEFKPAEFNLAAVHEAVERAVPDRDCIVTRTSDRAPIVAATQPSAAEAVSSPTLRTRGLGTVVDRATLATHESGQDHVALYATVPPSTSSRCSVRTRLAPPNVNYRYVADELSTCCATRRLAIVYTRHSHRSWPQCVTGWSTSTCCSRCRTDRATICSPAVWFDDALDAEPTELPAELIESWSPDDLYILYTGGTTGMPKGVMWRQGDIFVTSMGGRRSDDQQEWASYEQIAANAMNGGVKLLPGPPFMHGAAHWVAFNFFTNANTIVLPSVTEHLDVDDLLATASEEGVNVVLIVGDAFGRPLADGIEAAVRRGSPDLSSVLAVASGGAALSPGVKRRLLDALPAIIVIDGLGASETGQQATQLTAAGQESSTGDFTPGPGMCLLSDDLTRVFGSNEGNEGNEGNEEEIGWLAQSGRVPLGYLGDAAKTARTFPIVDGVRYAVPGDRARLTDDGRLELLGRDSVTINSGGEKIFAEEVEQAILRHPAVRDCVVAGRPSQRWGNEVVAIVALEDRPDATAVTDEELLDVAAGHIARYKLPKAIVRRDVLQRSPSGKADYRWAAAQAGA